MNKKIIKEYGGRYVISDEGEVYTYAKNSSGVRLTKSLTGNVNIKNNLYYTVGLTDGVTQKRIRVHRLVAKYFIPNPEGKKLVHHIDNNKLNNNVNNLQWVTSLEHAKFRDIDKARLCKYKNGDVWEVRGRWYKKTNDKIRALPKCEYEKYGIPYGIKHPEGSIWKGSRQNKWYIKENGKSHTIQVKDFHKYNIKRVSMRMEGDVWQNSNGAWFTKENNVVRPIRVREFHKFGIKGLDKHVDGDVWFAKNRWYKRVGKQTRRMGLSEIKKRGLYKE